MRPAIRQPLVSRSWLIAVLIGSAFVVLEYGLKFEIEGVSDPSRRSWLDLALFLGGYLFAFCLKPIQKAVLRKLCQRASHRTHQKIAR